MLRDDGLADRIEAGWEQAPLDARRRAIVEYVAKLTRTPARMQETDLAPLRAAGLEDVDILGVAEVAAYYAYVNRIANGLGVELEPIANER